MLQRSSMNSILLFLLYLGGASATVSSADSFGGTAFDYDGDHIADIAVRRPETFFHYVSNSANSDIQRKVFGRHENDIPVSGDFDGDGIFDFGVRRPSNHTWYILNSSGTDLISGNDDGITRLQFGRSITDIPVPADYDGDGRTDIAVRRTSNQTWYIHNSTGVDTVTNHDDGITRLKFGLQAADIPVPADYDGDGKADVAVRRASSQFWYIKNSAGQDLITNNDDGITRLAFGRNENDIPVPADYDGDGKADLAVRRASSFQWYIKNSSGVDSLSGSRDGISRITFGRNAADIPVIADYDGDNKADIAVRRATNQTWYIRNSSGIDNRSNFSDGISRQQFGLQVDDIPLAMPAHLIWLDSDVDYDGVSNEAEAQYGTDIGLSDTDGDGLSDGDEINIYQTNPTNTDSDADGVSDGDEVAVGTDPNIAEIVNNTTFNSQFLNNLSGYLSYGDRVVDGLLMPFADAWTLADGIAVEYENNNYRQSVKREYTYTVENEELLIFSTPELTSQSVRCNNKSIIKEMFPETVNVELIFLCEYGAFENNTFTVLSGLSEIHWQLLNSNESTFNIDITHRSSYIIVLPPAALESWDENLPLRIDVDTSLGEFDFIHTPPNLMPAMLDVELNGEWSMPLFYLPEIDRDLDNSSVTENFLQDRITFDNNLAQGVLSNKSYGLEVLDSAFVLTNGDEQLTVAPLEQLDKTFLVEVTRSLNSEHVSTYISLMSKFDGSGSEIISDPATTLPNVYAGTNYNWLKQSRDSGVISVENLFAFHLASSGKLNYEIYHYSDESSEYFAYSFRDWTWLTDVEQGSIISSVEYHTRIYTRHWEVINIASTGHIVVQEKLTEGRDRNSDGVIASDESYHIIAPKIQMLEVVDLSLYGDTWLDSDFDFDFLSNGEELELGTSLDNSDTDGDGFPDLDELNSGSNPLDSASLPLTLGELSFSDSNLKTCLLNDNAYSENTAVVNINRVKCDGKNIVNLQGVEQLNALKYVYLQHNAIVDLTPLNALTAIEYLNLDNNKISNMSGLSGLKNLEVLEASNNFVTDLSPVSILPNVRQLFFKNNMIASISPLLNLNSLSWVDVSGNDSLACAEVDNFELTMYPTYIVRPTSCTDVVVDTSLFVDANLRACVQEHNISKIIDADRLFCENMGIADLTGIEQLFALRSINMNDNQISDISPLQEMSQNLYYFAIERNNIVDLSSLSELENLRYLQLKGNKISDISSLHLLRKLSYLNLEGNQITELPELPNLQALTYLILNDNDISDINPLAFSGGLQVLNLNNNQIANIEVLSELDNIEDLYLNNNPIANIEVLSELVNIEKLSLNNNQIVNIDIFSELDSIEELYLNNNLIEDVSPLSSSSNLKKLILNNNKVSDISALKNMYNIDRLDLSHNLISDIEPLSKLYKLSNLDLSNNILSDVSLLSGFLSLRSIILDYNNIEVLPELYRNNLIFVSVEHNELRDVSTLAKSDSIEELRISGNQINDLTPLADITFLYRLHAADNGIEDLSPLAIHSDQMRELYIQKNDFTDVSTLFDFTHLETLDLSENTQISCSLLDQLGEALTDTVITLPETCSN